MQGQASIQEIETTVFSGRYEIKFQVLERPTQTPGKDPRIFLVIIKNHCR